MEEQKFGIYIEEYRDLDPQEILEIEIRGRIIWLISIGSGNSIPWHTPKLNHDSLDSQ